MQQDFHTSQSSLLFINCCFAVSFNGVLWLIYQSFNEKKLYHLLWLPLTVYLIFLVWRQFSLYFIPLQYYRNEPETEFEEGITFAITLTLGLFTLICFYRPPFSWLCLASIIILNIVKVYQMLRALPKAHRAENNAAKILRTFQQRLGVYFWLLILIYIVYLNFGDRLARFGADHFCRSGWTNCAEAADVTLSSLSPLVIYAGARVLFENLYQRQEPLSYRDYKQAVASAWVSTPEGDNNVTA